MICSSLKKYSEIFLVGVLVLGFTQGVALASCSGSEQVSAAASTSAIVDSSSSLRRLEPHYFGFSFVWVEFQDSLWHDASGHVDSEAINWLRAFPGAVYRYPGGTESNYYDWMAAVGPVSERKPRKAVKWKGPIIASFGLHEYLTFIREVGGKPWYVANLFGEYDKEGNSDELAKAAGQLARYLKKNTVTGETIFRWELGNELDRGWSEDKYLMVARQVAEAIRNADPSARFVAIMEDYDAHWRWRRVSAAEYNRKIASGFTGITSEFAQHSYYDGVHVEVPYSVAKRIAQICKSIEAAETTRPIAGAVKIWVTEHARQPVKNAKDAEWRPSWPKSANLEAALGVADFMIAATQIPEIEGLFVHALHGLDVPWPMFHKSMAGTNIHPSAVYWALNVLRQSMETEVLRTASQSANSGGYFGGYDFRASVMSNPKRTKWAAWMVNRSPANQAVELQIASLAGKTVRASLRVLADDNINANNYTDGNRLRPRDLPEQIIEFDKKGRAMLRIFPQSVTAARLEVL